MKKHEAAARSAPVQVETEPIFTVESANRALVYVRRIVEDITREQSELTQLRDHRAELGAASPTPDSLESLRIEMQQGVERLQALHEELNEVGCELKDWVTGLIDFPALRDGRRIWLCWKLGEDEIRHWHEVNEGFAGRKPL